MKKTLFKARLFGTAALTAAAVSTSLSIPSWAAVDEIVVTSERREASIQSVPIAVTAFDAESLRDQQIEGFSDLQLNAPNTNYTKSNFTGTNFLIRGIGTNVIATSADAGVGIHVNDAPGGRTFEVNYYDVERVEILRGPQGTLYGRNSTGGAVNFITNKPVMDETLGNLQLTYGNFDQKQITAMYNMPLGDNFAIRIAGDKLKRDGFTKNLYTGNKIDGRDQWSGRFSARYTPSEDTTVDLMLEQYEEDSNRSRAQKQLCSKDMSNPNVVALGCTPEALGFDQPYSSATAFQILGSVELATFLDGGSGAISSFSTGSLQIDANAGVTTPTDMRTVNLDFEPQYHASQTLARFQIQHDFDQHTVTLLTGYAKDKTWSRQDYDYVVGSPLTMFGDGPGIYDAFIDGAGCPGGLGLPFDCFDLDMLFGIDNGITTPTEAAIMLEQLMNFTVTGDPLGTPGPFTNTYSQGLYPISAPNPGDNDTGMFGGSILGFFDRAVAYDQSDGYNENFTQEIRINSNFDGPFNYILGGFYLRQESSGSYYVLQTALDHLAAAFSAATNIGAFLTNDPSSIWQLTSPYFRTDTGKYDLKSWAVFGEGYYDINDDMKFTVGLRYTEDDKSIQSRNPLFATLSTCPTGVSSTCPAYLHQENKWGEMTGRIGVDWNADLSFTDQTLIYAFFSRGYKGGGFNPPFTAAQAVLAGENPAVTFEPEFIKSIEIGMKNTLFNGTLQLNLTGFHYDYEGMQVTNIILNTSVNENTDATLWGLEAEWIWAPNDSFMMNGNVSYLNSEAEGAFLDPANPTGALDADPASANTEVALFKDINLQTSGGYCVLINDGMADAAFDATVAAIQAGFLAGQPFTSCPNLKGLVDGGAFGPDVSFALGVDSNINGNQLPMSPELSFKIGAQYTHHLANEGKLSGRIDYYWQDDMYARLFNGPTDKIESWDVWNATLGYESPDGKWFARAYVQNIADDDHVTGSYKTSPSTGLFTNLFTLDPRTYGLTVGVNF
ncbi:MAG: TonB-dependent receptor [Alphaproteobacteria bacterium]|nr:MAG: TonB-dependent receptor [Alphaproteobacteria bacterium]